MGFTLADFGGVREKCPVGCGGGNGALEFMVLSYFFLLAIKVLL